LIEGEDGVRRVMSTRDVAEAILAGTLPYGVRVSAPQGNKWLRAVDVPVIADILDTEPTRVDLPPTTQPATEDDDARTVRKSMFRTARGGDEADVAPETEAAPPTPPTPPTPRYKKLDTTLESVGTPRKRNAGGC
jgi:hypothetical protein